MSTISADQLQGEHCMHEIWPRLKNPNSNVRRAEQFEVTQSFLLQQAAWLYERQLSQVRAQMRRVGVSRPSATPSPGAGSTAGSMIGGQPMKRGGSGGDTRQTY